MKWLICFMFSLFCLQSAKAQVSDEDIIRKMLDDQVTEWNKGNLEGYMNGYWDNDSLLFIGSTGPRYGYKATLNKYKQSYPTVELMGTLNTSISSITQLADDYFFVVGKWGLKRKAGNVGGSYTLLIRKIDGEWLIVCDHSS